MFNKEHIKRIDFIKTYGTTYKIEMVALFNYLKISEEDVWKAIELEGMGNNPNVIIVTKDQFENVFTDNT